MFLNLHAFIMVTILVPNNFPKYYFNFPQNIMAQPLKWDISQLYTTYSTIQFGLTKLLYIDIHTQLGNVPIGYVIFAC